MTTEITAIATATGVLHAPRHRPTLAQVSPTAAAIRAEGPATHDSTLPTARDFAIAVALLAAFWAFYVAVWLLAGGLA